MKETKGDLLSDLARIRAELLPINEALSNRVAEMCALLDAASLRPFDGGPYADKMRGMKARGMPVPLCCSSIAGGAIREIAVRPQLLWRGERLWIDPRSAERFDILDYRIGQCSQGATSDPFPAEAFALDLAKLRIEDADRIMGTMVWELDVCEPGVSLTIMVRNRDAEAFHDFKAVAWGSALF